MTDRERALQLRALLMMLVSKADLTNAEAEKVSAFYPDWQADGSLIKAGERRNHTGNFWQCTTTHNASQTDEPGNSDKWQVFKVLELAEFVEGYLYIFGDECMYNGKRYLCTWTDGVMPFNPEEYPEGWTEVEN